MQLIKINIQDSVDYHYLIKLEYFSLNQASYESMMHFRLVFWIDEIAEKLNFFIFQKNDEFLCNVAELLKINGADLRKWLCNRKIVSGKEVFTKPMTASEVSITYTLILL